MTVGWIIAAAFFLFAAFMLGFCCASWLNRGQDADR